ncbi:MAG: 30S ribosomal protein S17 [Bdellovibrionaceae bacterium]|nr:30S ribosomal protein S17 [Pseudobdellovibrionaceae bacterium]
MSKRGRRNILTGQVVSDKMDKSISVSIYNLVKHPKYKKYIKKISVFKVHDEDNKAKVGDKVSIVETKALSKTKRWKLVKLLNQGLGQEEKISNPLDEIKSDKDLRKKTALEQRDKKDDTNADEVKSS